MLWKYLIVNKMYSFTGKKNIYMYAMATNIELISGVRKLSITREMFSETNWTCPTWTEKR